MAPRFILAVFSVALSLATILAVATTVDTCRTSEPARRLCGPVDFLNKLHAERFASTPHDLTSLARQRMRYGRKPKRASNRNIDLGDELRAIQRHIQDLTLVADKVIVKHEPCGELPRSSRFPLLLGNKHQNTVI
jgi:hypothetical protein